MFILHNNIYKSGILLSLMVEGLARLAIYIPAYITLWELLDVPFSTIARDATRDFEERVKEHQVEGWKPQDIAVVASVHSKLGLPSVGLFSYLANRRRKKNLESYSLNLLTVREAL